jgi:hypothetical protein
MMAVFVVSHLRPGALHDNVTEGYLTQPMLGGSGTWFGGRFVVHGMLNFEGATLRRGEINAGMYGEGYVDRRHPHTWLHEAMVGWRDTSRTVRWSFVAGKGFVPFGSDDPMVRSFVKFPVNHHQAQILERFTAVVAVRAGPVAVEAGSFNGDEPESPGDWPNAGRHFDSWSARTTWWPRTGMELSASLAAVESPEFAAGDGLDQRKGAASFRLQRETGWLRYGLLEVTRTEEFDDAEPAFTFGSVLGEMGIHAREIAVAARLERADRPEEERTFSFYRTVRPLRDLNILGVTRWTIVSMRAERSFVPRRGVQLLPFVEAAVAVPRATRLPTALDPVELFGASRLWAVSMGMRFHGGTMRSRAGRYAVAEGPGDE